MRAAVSESQFAPDKDVSKVMGIQITQNGAKWKVVINGATYEGEGNPQINLINNVLHIDGVPHNHIKPLTKDGVLRLEVEVKGDLKGLDTSGDVVVHGSVHGSVSTQGRVDVSGEVGHGIHTQGRVTCGNVGGSVDSQGRVDVNGDVGSKINTMGRVEVQGSVHGKIDTMGKVIVHNRK